MSNLTRYFIFAEGDPHESELVVVADKSGEWVKFDDIKGLLNSTPNRPIMPCERHSCCNCGNSACVMHGVNCHKFIPRTA